MYLAFFLLHALTLALCKMEQQEASSCMIQYNHVSQKIKTPKRVLSAHHFARGMLAIQLKFKHSVQ